MKTIADIVKFAKDYSELSTSFEVGVFTTGNIEFGYKPFQETAIPTGTMMMVVEPIYLRSKDGKILHKANPGSLFVKFSRVPKNASESRLENSNAKTFYFYKLISGGTHTGVAWVETPEQEIFSGSAVSVMEVKIDGVSIRETQEPEEHLTEDSDLIELYFKPMIINHPKVHSQDTVRVRLNASKLSLKVTVQANTVNFKKWKKIRDVTLKTIVGKYSEIGESLSDQILEELEFIDPMVYTKDTFRNRDQICKELRINSYDATVLSRYLLHYYPSGFWNDYRTAPIGMLYILFKLVGRDAVHEYLHTISNNRLYLENFHENLRAVKPNYYPEELIKETHSKVIAGTSIFSR